MPEALEDLHSARLGTVEATDSEHEQREQNLADLIQPPKQPEKPVEFTAGNLLAGFMNDFGVKPKKPVQA